MKKLVLLAIFPALFFAQANYKIQKDVISSGGTKMTAGNFVLHGTISQTTIGSVTGGNYKGIIGFWQPFDWVNPRAPYIVKVNKSGNNVILTWHKVTLDVNGYPEIIQYYSVYKDTLPNYTPGTGTFVGNSTGPETTYTNTGSLDATHSYYYLVKAVDYGPNRSRNSNMGFKFNKFFNENPGATSDRNLISIPWHNNYTTALNITDDLSPAGVPLIELANLRNDQLYESWVYDDLFGWYGDEFSIVSGKGYEMVANRDTTLYLLGSNNPNGLVPLNENAGGMSDRNWVSVPYNANYATVSDLTTQYSPVGIPLIELANLRNDQLYESWVYDDLFGWYGDDFAIERGRGFEFVAMIDTVWNPIEYTNEGGPIFFARRSKPDDIVIDNGKSVSTDRAAQWVASNDVYTAAANLNPVGRNVKMYRDVGISHIVCARLNIKDFKDITFTAYRPNQPQDVLTNHIIGCGVARKGDVGLVWFNTGNFMRPWQDGEEVLLLIEAVKNSKGYYAVVKFNLDKGVDIQNLSRVKGLVLIPIPDPKPQSSLSAVQRWEPLDNPDVVGYSLYNKDNRVNPELITGNEYTAMGSVALRPVFTGGYETVYGSAVEQKPVSPNLPIAYAMNIFPNPFNRATTIDYAMPAAKHLTIEVFDISGRLVKTLSSGFVKAGYYKMSWSGEDNKGRQVSSGVYFIRFITNDHDSRQKIVFVR